MACSTPPTEFVSARLPDGVSVLLRVRRVAELVALRLSLPSRLAAKSLDELLASLTPAARCPRAAGAQQLHRRDLLRAEYGVAHLPGVSTTCLYRALARYAILRRTGADATFVMAVDKSGIAAHGHAWVELDGIPFEEPDDLTRYTVTFRYPSSVSSGNVEAP